MELIRVSEIDDLIVDYHKERGMYRVSIFKDGHFKDKYWFGEYRIKCKDCKLKHYSESHNLWCDVFGVIMPEDGYCCFGGR